MSIAEFTPRDSSSLLFPIDWERPVRVGLNEYLTAADTPDFGSINFALWDQAQSPVHGSENYSEALGGDAEAMGELLSRYAYEYAATGQGGLALRLLDVAATWPDSVVDYQDYGRVAALAAQPTRNREEPVGEPSVTTSMAIMLDEERMNVGRHPDGQEGLPDINEEIAYALWWIGAASKLCGPSQDVAVWPGLRDDFFAKLDSMVHFVESHIACGGEFPDGALPLMPDNTQASFGLWARIFADAGQVELMIRMDRLALQAERLPPNNIE